MERPVALILLCGFPGAGKTTFATALAPRLDAAHIESDAIRRELFPAPRYIPREHARVFHAAEARVTAALMRGRDVVFDATNLVPNERTRFIRAAVAHDARLVCVRLTAPDELLRERLAAPREGWSQATVAVYEMMRERLRPFRQPAVIVDSRFDFRPAVDLVVNLVHDQEL